MATWIGEDFCTLPTAARPLRIVEFDELFQRQIAAPRWAHPHQAEFRFRGDLYDQVSDLVAREAACCSFFDFSITQEPDEAVPRSSLVLRVGVPASRHDVLEALTGHAVGAWNELSNEHA
jgi:hypothetical protein